MSDNKLDNKDEILARIAKLLMLSKDQADKPEGQSAAAMASKLMAKYRIAESEVNLENMSINDIFEDEEGWEGLCDSQTGQKRQWVSSLAGSICYTFDCKCWINPSNDTIHFIGTNGDIETALYFMDVIYGHIEREARKLLPRADLWKKRNVFGQAAEREVYSRLYQMKKDMDKELKTEYSGGYDIVVVKKGDLVKQQFDNISKLRGFVKGRDTSVRSTDQKIISAGIKAGKTAPLNIAIGK